MYPTSLRINTSSRPEQCPPEFLRNSPRCYRFSGMKRSRSLCHFNIILTTEKPSLLPRDALRNIKRLSDRYLSTTASLVPSERETQPIPEHPNRKQPFDNKLASSAQQADLLCGDRRRRSSVMLSSPPFFFAQVPCEVLAEGDRRFANSITVSQPCTSNVTPSQVGSAAWFLSSVFWCALCPDSS